MRTVKVKNLVLGEGMPKVCIPITGCSKEEIKKETEAVRKQNPDVAEWRIDCWEEPAWETEKWEMLRTISDILGEIPLLFTFRTAGEGGKREITREDYVKLLKEAAKTGLADLIDVEIFFLENEAESLVKELQKSGAKIIASNHHFDRTPGKTEIFHRFRRMEASGADVLKLAVMPQTPSDLYLLLEATAAFSGKTMCPLVTMSMGKMGVLSRLCGEITGSCMTFGAGVRASAPGQIPAAELKKILEEIHEIQESESTEKN